MRPNKISSGTVIFGGMILLIFGLVFLFLVTVVHVDVGQRGSFEYSKNGVTTSYTLTWSEKLGKPQLTDLGSTVTYTIKQSDEDDWWWVYDSNNTRLSFWITRYGNSLQVNLSSLIGNLQRLDKVG